MRSFFAVVAATAVVWAAGECRAEEAIKPPWIVVTAPAYRDAIAPLVKQREAEGFSVHVITTTNVATAAELARGEGGEKLLKAIATNRVAAYGESRGAGGAPLPPATVSATPGGSKRGAYVLLVGAAVAARGEDAAQVTVPALVGTFGRMKGQPSDNAYGFPVDAGKPVPTIAVGRLPVHTAAEAEGTIARILAYETTKNVPARRPVNVIIGDPGGRDGAERKLASAAVMGQFQSLSRRVHPLWTGKALIDVDGSAWAPPADGLTPAVAEMFDAPYGFVLFAGHSSAHAMVSGGKALLTRDDWARTPSPASIFISCGCFTSQYTDTRSGRGEGFGVAAIRSKTGPVAVIAPTAESFAFAGILVFDALMADFQKAELPPRLGDLFLHAKTGVASGKMNPLTFALYDRVDGTGGAVPLDAQRKEHVEMWTLLGDPAMAIPRPAPQIVLDEPTLVPGRAAQITGTLPLAALGADVELTLHRFISDPPATAGFAAANTTVLATVKIPAKKLTRDDMAATGAAQQALLRFTGEMSIPADLKYDRVIVRAAALSASGRANPDALGAVVVKPSKP